HPHALPSENQRRPRSNPPVRPLDAHPLRRPGNRPSDRRRPLDHRPVHRFAPRQRCAHLDSESPNKFPEMLPQGPLERPGYSPALAPYLHARVSGALMRINLKPLSEQSIVITGASSGIGLTTARMAAKKGARLVLVARNE